VVGALVRVDTARVVGDLRRALERPLDLLTRDGIVVPEEGDPEAEISLHLSLLLTLRLAG
jgi:hypothetical protein